jgi:beta-lactamase regulating signal transducer with metallopeptidase domain
MTDLFLDVLNTSFAATWVVLAVVAARFLLKKAPRLMVCSLWALVAARLLIGSGIPAPFSMIPSAEVIPQDIIQLETPEIHSAIPVINDAVNPLFTEYLTPEKGILEKGVSFASAVWAAGVGMMLLYSLFTYLRIRYQVQGSIRYKKNIYVCDDVASVGGTFTVSIYVQEV